MGAGFNVALAVDVVVGVDVGGLLIENWQFVEYHGPWDAFAR